MDPQVRYCTTTDGLSIGYWSIGGGETVIDAGQPPTHCEMEWRLAPMRRWYERFAVHHRLVRFDMRGCGLSSREVAEVSLDNMVRDLEGVVGALRLARFVLLGAINSGTAALAYAARHPERVSRLILWCAPSSSTIQARGRCARWRTGTGTCSRRRRRARALPGRPTRTPVIMRRYGGRPSSCATSEPSWIPWLRWTSRRSSGTCGRPPWSFSVRIAGSTWRSELPTAWRTGGSCSSPAARPRHISTMPTRSGRPLLGSLVTSHPRSHGGPWRRREAGCASSSSRTSWDPPP